MDISNYNNNNQSTATAICPILPSCNTVGLDTVRALHQTVVSLRAALESSQVELSRLRDKIKHRAEYRDAIEKLSIENHILRRKIIQNEDTSNEQICMAATNELTASAVNLNKTNEEEVLNSEIIRHRPELNSIPTIELPDDTDDKSEKSELELEFLTLQSLTNQSKLNLSIEKDLENLSLKSYSEGDNSVFSDNEHVAPAPKNDSENESEEVDDIELIFTTEETKELGPLQEDLVSIIEPEQSKGSDTDTPILVNYKTTDFDSGDINGGSGTADNSDDDVFVTDNRDNLGVVLAPSGPGSDISKQRSLESQDSFIDKSFEKDESFDQFDEKEKKLQKMWSQCSVLVETDISKCGVLDDSEMPNLASRRNTCPNPLAYRPVIYRDNFMKATIQPNPTSSSAGGRKYYRTRNSFQSSSIRPILNEKSALKTESEAQTDISALPCPWKSESYLAHKVAHNFTTLPSKFALPIYQQPKMRLSEKTQEARRVLLSDINFTSMVPELSRSADHLCQEDIENIPPSTYHTRGQYLRTPEAHRKYDTSDILTSPNFGKYYSPSDYSNFGSSRFDSSLHGMNRYRGSLTSITSPSQYDIGRHSYWRQNVPQSFDGSSRGRFSYSSRPTFGSVPTSPTRHHRSRSVPHVQRSIDSTSSRYSFGRSYSRPTSQWGFGQRNKTRSRVTFEDTNLRCNSRTNHSLPDLRSDSYDSGGDSTDSLVEEAEHFLRRSIDCMVSGGPMGHTCDDWKTERSRVRRASAPDPVRETDPPAGATPYLPRIPRDLRLGHWVKVIGPEGRVRGGRVRHVGVLIDDSASQNTAYIGVELATPTGNSDGSYQGKRFFDCEPDHAIFVPFKKVIMAWNT